MAKIRYISEDGYTEDAAKAIYGAVTDQRELRSPRFSVAFDGTDLIWEERECGLPKVSTKQKRGGSAEKATTSSTRSAKSASKKGS